MNKIQNLVELYYGFWQQSNTLTYIRGLLHKNNYLCDNIENLDN